MAREKIELNEPVGLVLTERQIHLIIEHTFADPELNAKLENAETRGHDIIAKYTLDDLDAPSGFVAAEANYCKDTKLKDELDALFDCMRITLESYDDGEWPNAF